MAEENREVSMTVTTTITISHEEMNKLGLRDDYLKQLGYHLKSHNEYGKVFEKIFWTDDKEKI